MKKCFGERTWLIERSLFDFLVCTTCEHEFECALESEKRMNELLEAFARSQGLPAGKKITTTGTRKS